MSAATLISSARRILDRGVDLLDEIEGLLHIAGIDLAGGDGVSEPLASAAQGTLRHRPVKTGNRLCELSEDELRRIYTERLRRLDALHETSPAKDRRDPFNTRGSA